MCERKDSREQLANMRYLSLASAKLHRFGAFVQQVKLEGEKKLATMIIIDCVDPEFIFGIKDL